MKKLLFIFLGIITLVQLTSCNKEDLSDVIDIDPQNLSVMSESEKQLYIEARNRVDAYVVFLNNQYYLNVNSGK